jgi:ABC-2 type transport system ATP-binding protein
VDTDKLDGLLRQLTAVGVRSLISQPPTLEQLFLRHYSGDGGEGAGDSGAGDSSAGDSGDELRRTANESGAPA